MGICRFFPVVFWAMILEAGLLGCGSVQKPIPVSGTVTLDGEPLAHTQVVFTPMAGGRDAVGVSDSQGQFSLGTLKTGDGAYPGQYKVTVKVLGPPNLDVDSQKHHPMAMGKVKQAPPKPSEKTPLHANYGDLQKTPLRVDVPVSGALTLPLNKNGT